MYGACNCGCAYHECECGPDRISFSEAQARAFAAIKAVKAKKVEERKLKIGMWVRITSGAYNRLEGRVSSIGSRLVQVTQLNGCVLVIGRDMAEHAPRGTGWGGLLDQLGSRP